MKNTTKRNMGAIPKLRLSGVALPIFALPSNYGIGTIGKSAKKFIDFLSDSGFSYWSILPLGPTSFCDSPFQSISSRALNPYLIDLDDLIEKGLLKKRDLSSINWGDDPLHIDYQKIFENRIPVLKKAYRRFKKGQGDYQRGYTVFLRSKKFSDFACFMVLKEKNHDCSWVDFKTPYQNYSPSAFRQFKRTYRDEIEFYEWTQYIFLKQWGDLKEYAHSKNVHIIGIMPMHVAYDSIDVYKHAKNFLLNSKNRMDVVAGYPPDIFYKEGQSWGSPLYRFDFLKKNDYRLFKDRLNFNYSLYDIVVLDHFRGYLENYAIPYGSKNGLKGEWSKTEGKRVVDLFVSDKSRVIAETVDWSNQELTQTLEELQIKDMCVAEFGFPRESSNFNRPINYSFSCVSYSTTHDCMPLKGYFEEMSPESLNQALMQINTCCKHFGVKEVTSKDPKEITSAILELNLASLSAISIQSMTDILYQGKEGRINTPGFTGPNWRYRISENDFSPTLAKQLRELNRKYGRCD